MGHADPEIATVEGCMSKVGDKAHVVNYGKDSTSANSGIVLSE